MTIEALRGEVTLSLDDLKTPAVVKDKLVGQNGHGIELAGAVGNLLAINGHEPTAFELFRHLESHEELKPHVEAIKREYKATKAQLHQR